MLEAHESVFESVESTCMGIRRPTRSCVVGYRRLESGGCREASKRTKQLSRREEIGSFIPWGILIGRTVKSGTQKIHWTMLRTLQFSSTKWHTDCINRSLLESTNRFLIDCKPTPVSKHIG